MKVLRTSGSLDPSGGVLVQMTDAEGHAIMPWLEQLGYFRSGTGIYEPEWTDERGHKRQACIGEFRMDTNSGCVNPENPSGDGSERLWYFDVGRLMEIIPLMQARIAKLEKLAKCRIAPPTPEELRRIGVKAMSDEDAPELESGD